MSSADRVQAEQGAQSKEQAGHSLPTPSGRGARREVRISQSASRRGTEDEAGPGLPEPSPEHLRAPPPTMAFVSPRRTPRASVPSRSSGSRRTKKLSSSRNKSRRSPRNRLNSAAGRSSATTYARARSGGLLRLPARRERPERPSQPCRFGRVQARRPHRGGKMVQRPFRGKLALVF